MPKFFIDISNQRFGRLLAIQRAPRQPHKVSRGIMWLCQCDCGKAIIVSSNSLRTGNTRSCGCLQVEVARASNTVHGAAGRGRETPEYRTWQSIFERCYKPKAASFKHYGGRGIAVCERWGSFENFLADMGARPEGCSIDRIDNNGNYEPGNCRWATSKEQANNRGRRHPKFIKSAAASALPPALAP